LEILSPERYHEYEKFITSHPTGSLTQSVLWHGVKSNWNHGVVVSRDESGDIIGGMSVLIQKVPFFGVTMLYSPRGPVCDYHNLEVLADLKKGADELAKRHNAYTFKVDPDILIADEEFPDVMKAMGFTNFRGGDGFETIQPRFNSRLYFEDRSEEDILMSFTQGARRNVRIAQKHGVEIKVVDGEYLDEFVRLMQITGARDGFTVRSKSYFAGLLKSLGEHARLYMAFHDGKALAGAITTVYAGKAAYLYGASDNESRNLMPTYLIQWEMIRRAAEMGCTVYDFQGVSGNFSEENNPLYGLYRFKKGFGTRVDELVGEYDYFYKPKTAKLIDIAIDAHEKLRKLKKR